MNNFASALKAQTTPVNAPSPTPASAPLIPYIKVISSVNPRLEVTFNRYPGPAHIGALKNAGFRWIDEKWQAPDTQARRDFLNAHLNAKLEPFAAPPVIPTPAPVPELIVRDTPPDDNTPLGKYRRQVDELVEKLNHCPADIFLEAIDCYYKVVFSN